MADFNSTSPELYNQVNHNETPSNYERRLDSFPVVSEKTWRVIIDTEKNVATILVSGKTKKKTNELNESLTLDKLYNKEIAWLDENFSIKNLDILLKSNDRRWLINTDLESNYNWYLNKNNDIVIWNKILKKWSEEYNKIMIKVLDEMKIFWKILLIDAKNRKSKVIFELNK